MGFLNKRKIVKSVSYYISETVIVIIGIFIAIQLNNINQVRKNNSDGVEALKRISVDLATEKFMLESHKKRFLNSKKYLVNVVYNDSIDNLDSITYHFNAFRHYKMNSEYINLKYSGKLNLIKNDKLRYYIVSFYEVYYSGLEAIAEKHKKQIDGKIGNYFENEFPVDTTHLIKPEIVKLKLKDQEFKEVIIEQINALDFVCKNMQTQSIDTLINMIHNEISIN